MKEGYGYGYGEGEGYNLSFLPFVVTDHMVNDFLGPMYCNYLFSQHVNTKVYCNGLFTIIVNHFVHLIAKQDQKVVVNTTHFTIVSGSILTKPDHSVTKSDHFITLNYKTGSQKWIILMLDSDWSAAEPRGVRSGNILIGWAVSHGYIRF